MVKTHYVIWIKLVLLCLPIRQIECRPSDKCNSHDADCRSAIELEMHPTFARPKRGRNQEQYRVNGDYYDESSSLYWNSRAQMTLRMQLLKETNQNVAKNVILFLGDGMSLPTITGARIYSGQKRGKKGEESRLSFEQFPYVGLSKTYCIDKQVADSACTATAYLCGVKSNFQTVGVNGRVQLNDCRAGNNSENQVHSLLQAAQKAGKGTGIVTTTTVTHASPSAAYAHSSNRAFECDADVVRSGQDPNECEDIASQLVRNGPGKNFKVILGGGRAKFLPKSMEDGEGNQGERLDDRNLIQEWHRDKENAEYIYDKVGLDNLDLDSTEYVLGLFSDGHMSFNLEADRTKEPSLLELTETAIKLLQKEKRGFVLFVEGGRIDHGHHSAQAIKALDETVEFSNAIKRAVELTDRKDTLIVVTSDHAHTMSIAGYPDRGNPIDGLNSVLSDVDDLPTITLSYANGPGYRLIYNEDGSRKNLTGYEFPPDSVYSGTKADKDTIYPGLFPTKQETHGGDDVGVFAYGCMSHLFTGVYEQNTIPHLISYASCIGDGLTTCNQFD